MQRLTRHLKDPLNLLLIILVVSSLLGAWQFGKHQIGVDYYVAWVAADAVNNDTPHNIYEVPTRYKLALEYRNKADASNSPRQKKMAQWRNELPMTASPFLYWFTGLIAVGDYETDIDVWHAISILSLTLSILVMCRLLGYSTATSLAFLIPVLVWFSPLHIDLQDSNVNSVQLGMIAITLWLLWRGPDKRYLFATGLVVGLMVMFKPNLAPIALLLSGGWALRQQYSNLVIALSGMTTGAISAFLISSWWLGSYTVWFDWATIMNATIRFFALDDVSHMTIAKSTGVISPVGQISMTILYCLLVLTLLWWGRRRDTSVIANNPNNDREKLENTLLVAMGSIVLMLTSSLVWIHYCLLMIPMFIVIFRPWQDQAPPNLLPMLMQRILPAVAFICLMDTAAIGIFELGEKGYWAKAATISISLLFVAGLWQFVFGINRQPGRKVAVEPDVH